MILTETRYFLRWTKSELGSATSHGRSSKPGVSRSVKRREKKKQLSFNLYRFVRYYDVTTAGWQRGQSAYCDWFLFPSFCNSRLRAAVMDRQCAATRLCFSRDASTGLAVIPMPWCWCLRKYRRQDFSFSPAQPSLHSLDHLSHHFLYQVADTTLPFFLLFFYRQHRLSCELWLLSGR